MQSGYVQAGVLPDKWMETDSILSAGWLEGCNQYQSFSEQGEADYYNEAESHKALSCV